MSKIVKKEKLNTVEYSEIISVKKLLRNNTIKIFHGNKAYLHTFEIDTKYLNILNLPELDTDNYDLIIGYRADDSYFAYAESFVSGGIYKDTLEMALRTDELGLQVFVKSEKAFERLKKIAVEEVPGKYRNYFVSRDKRARDNYLALRLNQGNRIGKQTIYDFI